MSGEIRIVQEPGGTFNVRRGAQESLSLTWDEMLGQVVSLTFPVEKRPLYPLRTAEEWAIEREEWARRHPEIVG
jgi:hypothetical protein